TRLKGGREVPCAPHGRACSPAELPGTMHGGGDPTQLPGVVPSTPANCQLPTNPNAFIPQQRALLIALRQWIVNGTEPPPSMISKLSNGSLTGASMIRYPYVPATNFDADGNPIDGLRNVFVQVPLGTYTGWNVRKAGFSEGDSCDLSGGYIPFFRTQ